MYRCFLRGLRDRLGLRTQRVDTASGVSSLCSRLERADTWKAHMVYLPSVPFLEKVKLRYSQKELEQDCSAGWFRFVSQLALFFMC